MKRWFWILLALPLLAGGCGKKSDDLADNDEIKNLWTVDDRKVNDLLNQAQKLKEGGQVDQAVALYNQAATIYLGGDPGKYTFNWGLWAQMCVGEAYQSQGHHDQAIAAYRKIADKFRGGSPDDSWAIEAHKKIVESNRAMKKEKQAIEELKRIVEAENKIVQTSPTDPSVAWAALEIGWCYAQMKDWKKAVDAYEKAKQNYPQGSWAGQADLGIADCYDKQGNRKKSREILNRIIEQYPKDWAEQARRRLAEMDGKPVAPSAGQAPAGGKAPASRAGGAGKR